MADWDNAARYRVNQLKTAADYERDQDNLEYIAGVLAGQSPIATEVPLEFKTYLESTHATTLDQTKDMGPLVSSGFGRNRFEYESHAPTGVILPVESRIKAAIENTDGTDRQPLGDLVFARVSEGTGLIQLLSYILGATEAGSIAVTTGTNSEGEVVGRVGIRTTTPEYELDVPSGVINVSGDYRRDGAVIADWTVTPGTPDVVSYSGPAEITQTAVSEVATGTAPLAATSTTECTGLSASTLEAEIWHPGIMASGFDTYGASDTEILSEPLNRVGRWCITASVSVFLGGTPDAGLTINVKLKDGSGTQIGETADFEAAPPATGEDSVTSVKVRGVYVSAAGNEDIKVYVAVPTGTGAIAEATLVMAWQGP